MRTWQLLLCLSALMLAACTANGDPATDGDATANTGPTADDVAADAPTQLAEQAEAIDAPDASAPLAEEVEAQFERMLEDSADVDHLDVDALVAADDVRAAWPLVDLLRFVGGDPATAEDLDAAVAELTGYKPGDDEVAWVAYTDLLLAAEVPAPPGYLDVKEAIYLERDPTWAPFFDPDADLDWREVAWGGVGRDEIAALVDARVVAAEEAEHLDADDVVFGMRIGDEARAYPRRFLEVHEMANDTLGGRRVAFSYCTLCGAPIPYAVDDVEGVDEPLELRTSGLLQRANKLMYDVQTESLFDQFTGVAVSGPLRDAEVELERLQVTVTRWEDWREQQPETTVLAVPGRRGAEREILNYPGTLRERRDADGPIFPVGERDKREGEAVVVLGVETPRGASVAFPVEDATEALEAGEVVRDAGVQLMLEDGGLVARGVDGGPELPAHEAFWFAWSQFRPDTDLWER